MNGKKERLQKIIARAGVASRRKADALVAEGKVTVNGKVAQLGDQATAGKDAIKVSGKLLRLDQAPVYLVFHKPKAVISTQSESLESRQSQVDDKGNQRPIGLDEKGRKTLDFFLKRLKTKVFPVGRLDYNGEGLMILTNDGDFSSKLLNSRKVPRVYRVKVKGHPSEESLAKLSKGGRIDGRRLAPRLVKVRKKYKSKSLIEIVFVGMGLLEIKRFFENKGFRVERIIRYAIGHLSLKDLPVGHYRGLKKSQVDALLSQPELGLQKYSLR